MSFAFDTLSQAWATLRQRLPEDVQSAELTMRFEFLLEELHEANHRLKDAVNKDPRVSSIAVRLSRCPPLPKSSVLTDEEHDRIMNDIDPIGQG